MFSAASVAGISSHLLWHREWDGDVVLEDFDISTHDLNSSVHYLSTQAPDSKAWLRAFQDQRKPGIGDPEDNLQAYLHKMKQFEKSHHDDVYVDQDKYRLLVSTFKRVDRVQNLVGHGNFNVVSFDEMIKFARRYNSIGKFGSEELDFLEELFFANAKTYGFYGAKVQTELTAEVPERDRFKVRHTGHFVYKGESLALYRKVKRELGRSIILTSGIRSIVKQTHLFLAKTIQSKGNLSRASRSLAPPGHSFHGIGDFDVGKVGFGAKNFTAAFARTEEFRRLVDLGYVDMRYPRHNLLGVRYEPWHIKVV